MSNLFENAVCSTKYELKNGGFAFYINRTSGSFSHSAGHLLAYNGHIYEYNNDGLRQSTEEVHIDYLPETNPDFFGYGKYDIIKRID